MAQFSKLVPYEGELALNDVMTVNVVTRRDGAVLNTGSEYSVRVRKHLRLGDAEILAFGEAFVGARVGDTRVLNAVVSAEASAVELRGETVEMEFTIVDLKRVQLPELTPEFLEREAGVKSIEELKSRVKEVIERQLKHEQRSSARRQFLDLVTESATWDLPEELVKRQVENALYREYLEMRQAGYSDDEINARENELRQRQISMTRQALKEHFVLDSIAEKEKLEVTEADFMFEINLMALQSGETPRKVRSKLEKQGLMENLEAQILERKAVDIVLEKATYVDVPAEEPAADVYESMVFMVCGKAPEQAQSSLAALKAQKSVMDDHDHDHSHEHDHSGHSHDHSHD